MRFRIQIFILLFILLFPASAYAYLDPATGSLIIQVVIGVIAGILYGIKQNWLRLKASFLEIKLML